MTGARPVCFGRAKIQPLASGAYRPSDAGQWAVILEVRDRHNELADLVAWLPNDPAHWWLRHGDEAPVLGARALAFAADFTAPVSLLPTPEQWLFARFKPNTRAIACVLDWGVALGPLFEGVSQVDCDTPELQKQLQRSLRAREPRITAPRQGARRAA